MKPQLTLNRITVLPVAFINVYEVDRCYGGSEEGGWWYDAGEPVAIHPVIGFSRDQCIDYAHATKDYDWPPPVQALWERVEAEWQSHGNANSVVYRGGDFRVRLQDHPGRSYPEYAPHYE